MKLSKYDWYAVTWLALAGMFNASMDTQMFYKSSTWLYAVFDWLGWENWYLATGGNKVWRVGVLVWDGWHVFKNCMWLSVGIACTHLRFQQPLTWWMRLLLGIVFACCISLTFIIFFHWIYGAPIG